jgi:hypothetical protein
MCFSYLLLAVRQEVGVGLEVTTEIVLDVEHKTDREDIAVTRTDAVITSLRSKSLWKHFSSR